MLNLIAVIDEDSLQSKVYQTDHLEKKQRRIKAVELAAAFAKEVTPEFNGKLALDQYADSSKMTVVSFARVK